MSHVAFDLDGTLADPGDGIADALNFALARMGRRTIAAADTIRYVGPPLEETFSLLMPDATMQQIETAVHAFRQRYGAIGYRRCKLYEGVLEVLKELRRRNHLLYVVTSKQQDIATRVIESLGIAQSFARVRGALPGKSKHEALRLIRQADPERWPLFMVGDRASDMEAAHAVSASAIGVTWGFGTREELVHANAHVVVDHPRDVLDAIDSVA